MLSEHGRADKPFSFENAHTEAQTYTETQTHTTTQKDTQQTHTET